MGLLCWGQVTDIITGVESQDLSAALPGGIVGLNDREGWTFPDFYEYLLDKEAKEEPQPVEVPVEKAKSPAA